jgi:hypothetical protein
MEHTATAALPKTRQEKLEIWRQEKNRVPAGTSSNTDDASTVIGSSANASRRTSFARPGSAAAMAFIGSLRRSSLVGSSPKPSKGGGRRMSSWGRRNSQKENLVNNTATSTRNASSSSFKVRSTRTNSADAATAAASSARHQSFKVRRHTRSELDTLEAGAANAMLPPFPRAPRVPVTNTAASSGAAVTPTSTNTKTAAVAECVEEKKDVVVTEIATQTIEEPTTATVSVGTATVEVVVPECSSVAIQTDQQVPEADATVRDDPVDLKLAMTQLKEQHDLEVQQHKQEMSLILENNDSLAQMAIELQDKLQACEQQVGELQFANEVMLQQQREIAVKVAKERRENHGLRHLQSRMHDQKLEEQSAAFAQQVSTLNNSLRAGLEGAVSKIHEQQAQLDRNATENKALRKQLALLTRARNEMESMSDHHQLDDVEEGEEEGEEEEEEDDDDVENEYENENIEVNDERKDNSGGNSAIIDVENVRLQPCASTPIIQTNPLVAPRKALHQHPHLDDDDEDDDDNDNDDDEDIFGGGESPANSHRHFKPDKAQSQNKNKNKRRQSMMPTSLSDFVIVDEDEEVHRHEVQQQHQHQHRHFEQEGLFIQHDHHRRDISGSVSSISTIGSCESARGSF